MSVLSKKLIHWRVQVCRLAKVHKYLTQLSSQGKIEMANAALRLWVYRLQSPPSVLPTSNLEHFQSDRPQRCQSASLAVTTELGSDCCEMPFKHHRRRPIRGRIREREQRGCHSGDCFRAEWQFHAKKGRTKGSTENFTSWKKYFWFPPK